MLLKCGLMTLREKKGWARKGAETQRNKGLSRKDAEAQRKNPFAAWRLCEKKKNSFLGDPNINP